MRARLTAAAAVVATLAAAPAAQAVDQPPLDRINDSMAAYYGVRLPVRYVELSSDRVGQLNRTEADGYVVEIDPDHPDDAAETCETVAHEYTHWVRRDQEAAWVATLPAARTSEDVIAAQHRDWPQNEAQPYPPCRYLATAAAQRLQMEDRAWRLDEWLSSARPLSWKNCRSRKTASARKRCVRQVDAKWRHRRQVRATLSHINRQLGA